VRALLERNRKALDILTEVLVENEKVDGIEVRKIVMEHGCAEDLAQREEAVFARLL
jgi:ATP-dependent Zn protease